MKIIVAGDGQTGTHLASILSVENQDVVLIGSNSEHLERLDSESNFITFEGNPLSHDNLIRCGVESSDLFIAVTPDENVNLLACEIAKNIGARRCVARINTAELDSSYYNGFFNSHGIDMTIYPERLAALEICRFIEHNWVNEWFELHGGALLVIGIRMRGNSPLIGKSLKGLPNDPRLFHVALIKRGEEIIIPRGDDKLNNGDIVYFTVEPSNVTYLPELCGCETSKVRQIMISGGGQITENLLDLIASKYIITVVEPDKDRCRELAAKFNNITVVNALANDVNTLKEEGIDNCDMFLGLSGSSETNIVSCMVAREHGVSKTVARIEELQYIPEAESLSIDKIINKKLINVGKVLNVLIETASQEAHCMSLDKAEIIELTAGDGSKVTSRNIGELSLPKDITIGGLIRNGKGYLVQGQTLVTAGDRVTIFCKEGSLSKARRLFN